MFSKEKIGAFFSSITGRYSPAFITLVVLAGFFFFYFTVVVNKNEADLKERNFRGLRRIGENISKKISNYKTNNSLNFSAAILENRQKPKVSQRVIEEQYHLHEEKPRPAEHPDSIHFFIDFDGSWKFYFQNTVIEKDTCRLPDSVKCPPVKTTVLAAATVSEFISPLLRYDFFQHYFLSMGDSIIMDDLNKSIALKSKYLAGNVDIDSVKKGQVIQTGQIRKMELGGKEYKLFLLPIIVEGHSQFWIGGYMPEKEYSKQQRYLPTYGVLWLAIGIMLVILMFPLLKVFFMHRSEQLVARNVISSLGSIHILGSLVVLVALNTYAYFAIVKKSADTGLRDLARKIDTVFNNEINAALGLLDTAEWQLSRQAETGLIKDTVDYSQTNYPFFLHISWADSSGIQKLRWSSTHYKGQKIDVSDRDYFVAVKEKNLWRKDGNKPFYLTEISSRVEEKNLAIISRQVSRPFTGRLDSLISLRDSLKARGDSTQKELLLLQPQIDSLQLAAKRIDSLKLYMISVSGPFRSMFNPVVAEGTGFCIIKDDGDIIFHVEDNRNLNENLAEETDYSSALRSLIHAKNSGFFGATYSGSTYRFYITPLKGMPYFLVTYTDIRSIWAEDMDVVSACSILSMMNLAVILIAILIIQAAGYRRSLLQYHSSVFPWLQPNNRLVIAYQSVILIYLTSILLQVGFFLLYKGQDELCLAGILFSYSFALITYAYYQFAVLKYPEADKPAADAKIEKNPAAFKALWFLAFFYAAATIIFITNLWGDVTELLYFLSAQLCLGLAMWLVTIRNSLLSRKNRVAKLCQQGMVAVRKGMVGLRKLMVTIENKKNYRWWYTWSVCLFIVATGVVPSVLFYCMSCKQERLLSLKNTQLNFTNRLLQQSSNSAAGNITRLSGPDYQKPFYFNCFADSITASNQVYLDLDSSGNKFEQLYKTVKPSFSDHASEIEFLKSRFHPGDEINWRFREKEKELTLQYKVNRINTFAGDRNMLSIYSRLQTGPAQIKKAIKNDWLSFWLLLAALAALAYGFFFLLQRLIRKVFFDGYTDMAALDQFEANFIKLLPENENLLINGLINSGKNKAIEDYFVKEKQYGLYPNPEDGVKTDDQSAKDKEAGRKALFLQIDIARFSTETLEDIKKEIPAAAKSSGTTVPKKDVVVIRHFEMFMDDIKLTETKLHLLEFLLRRDFTRIIILTARPYECMIRKREKTDSDPAIDLTDRWTNMMNKFYTVFYQWQEPKEKEGNSLLALKEKIKDHCYAQIRTYKNNNALLEKYLSDQVDDFFANVKKECSGSDFLWGLRAPIASYLEANMESCFHLDFLYDGVPHMRKIIKRHFINLHENICLRIQSLAHNYYLSLWQSLSPDEQITLYDIAIDEMVNPANRDYAMRLAGLGIIKPLGAIPGYSILNTSFRNFIFTRIGSQEVNDLRNEGTDKGSWNSFQLPLLIIVIALGVFLFTTQKDAFSSLITYLGAAIGGIGALLRVLGMIPSR